ncbi:hypothetical protein ACO2I3_13550 [Leptospira interrogans]
MLRDQGKSVPEDILYYFTFLVVLGATAYRLFPIALGQPWLSEFFITEDGYLMLTVARNMAIGHGLSVSDGSIPTNGVQPLATFLFSLSYLATDGDKVASLVGVIFLSAAFSIAGLFAVRAFARTVLQCQDANPLWPWLSAALWYTGPLLLLHTMNGLETGLYTLTVVTTLVWFGRLVSLGSRANLSDRLIFGALCGVTFLARNDGVFLAIATFGSWTVYSLFTERRGFVSTFLQLLPSAAVTLLIATPWLVNNKINFGSIVPISGAAQSIGSHFGQNAALVPVKLFEHLVPMLPIPGSFESKASVIATSAAVVTGVLIAFVLGVWRRGGSIRFVIASYILYGILLCGYYGFFFGAPHFMSRYLAPLSPLLIVAAVSVMISSIRSVMPNRTDMMAAVAGIAALLMSSALLVRLLLPGIHVHEHFQVVRWINSNVSTDTWIGAVQTGTLGYWHDRTINLDGKVNPEALNVLRRDGHALNYITASPIAYLADWVGIASWMQRPEAQFTNTFELIVVDPAANLAVMRRRAPHRIFYEPPRY